MMLFFLSFAKVPTLDGLDPTKIPQLESHLRRLTQQLAVRPERSQLRSSMLNKYNTSTQGLAYNVVIKLTQQAVVGLAAEWRIASCLAKK